MRIRLRSRLTYANLISSLALFLALGGVGYAATQLPKNSVGTQQIKKNAVTTVKIKNGSVTGEKINLASLGTVPNAAHAGRADTAGSADVAANADNAGKLGGIEASGYQARVMWARVTNGGEIAAQSGGIEPVSHASNGFYLLHFPQPVNQAAIVVTGRWTGANAGKSVTFKASPCGPGGAECTGLGANTVNDLFVEVLNGTTLEDQNFYVAAIR